MMIKKEKYELRRGLEELTDRYSFTLASRKLMKYKEVAMIVKNRTRSEFILAGDVSNCVKTGWSRSFHVSIIGDINESEICSLRADFEKLRQKHELGTANVFYKEGIHDAVPYLLAHGFVKIVGQRTF